MPNPHVVYAECADNEVVLFNLLDRVAHRINGTAMQVFQLVDGRRSVDQIAQIVARTFQISPDRSLQDVQAILAAFHNRKLIYESSEKDSPEGESECDRGTNS